MEIFRLLKIFRLVKIKKLVDFSDWWRLKYWWRFSDWWRFRDWWRISDWWRFKNWWRFFDWWRFKNWWRFSDWLERTGRIGPVLPAKWNTALWELKQINFDFISKFEPLTFGKNFFLCMIEIWDWYYVPHKGSRPKKISAKLGILSQRGGGVSPNPNFLSKLAKT